MHIIHSITRPAELRYKDLIESIAECSQNISQLAVYSSHAEQRIVHQKLDLVLSRWSMTETQVQEMREKIIGRFWISKEVSSKSNGL
jgi:hypothetical protein